MPSFIERVGIDLDEIGADLTLYKSLQSIYPQLGIRGEVSNVSFQFGASDIVGQEPLWSTQTVYDPRTDNKVDIREAGRYLAYRLYHAGPTDFTFSGFDLKVSRSEEHTSEPQSLMRSTSAVSRLKIKK